MVSHRPSPRSWCLLAVVCALLVPLPLRAESPAVAPPAAAAAPAQAAAPQRPARSGSTQTGSTESGSTETGSTESGSSLPEPALHLPLSSSPEDGLPSAEEGDTGSLGWSLVRTLVMLAAIMALIYLTLNVGLRRLLGLQGVPGGSPALVSVVERVTLDQRRTLFVLKAADEYLLVGGSEGGLSLLSKLDAQAVERLRAQHSRESGAAALSPFLQKLLSRRGSPPPSA